MKTLCPPSLLSPSSLPCSSLPILICILSVIDELPNDSSLSSTGMMAGIPCNLSPLVFVFKVPQATRGGIKEVVKMRKERCKADNDSEKALFPELLWSVCAPGVAICRAQGNSVRNAWGIGRPEEHLSTPVGPCQVLVDLQITKVSHPLTIGAPQHGPHTV